MENDYGLLNGYGSQTRTTTTKRGQVYQATHNGEGQTLPYMNRSFISFTFGGKRIEDFDLLATISGDRLNRKGYASFDDTVTSYDNLDGQYYWATHYKTNQMDFTLSTDGIDEKQLDNFKHWFKAGVTRELILAEHPNRAIMARVSAPPTLNLLPFETDVKLNISSIEYSTKTTLYKGDIQLSLVMDKPHWYAVSNVLGKKSNEGGREHYVDLWTDAQGREVSIFASQDALKILYEDGIPLGSMIDTSMLLGNGAYANVDNDISSCVWNPFYADTVPHIINNLAPNIPDPQNGGGACVNGVVAGTTYTGIVAGAIVDASNNGITSLSENNVGYFYYAGTAPSPTTISFTLVPEINNSTFYIITPYNSHTSTKYNTLTIESLEKQELHFTTPNIFTSYNKCIEIFSTRLISTNDWEKIREIIRDQVRHPKAREWAIKCIEYAVARGMNVNSSTGEALKLCMSYFLRGKTGIYSPFSASFSFNSETGEALGTFSYRQTTGAIPADASAWSSYGTILTNQVEDVGDMLKSNYIIIQDRNYPNEYGKIVGWQGTNDITKQYSHRIYHNVDTPLTNIQILYKNMYL